MPLCLKVNRVQRPAPRSLRREPGVPAGDKPPPYRSDRNVRDGLGAPGTPEAAPAAGRVTGPSGHEVAVGPALPDLAQGPIAERAEVAEGAAGGAGGRAGGEAPVHRHPGLAAEEGAGAERRRLASDRKSVV